MNKAFGLTIFSTMFFTFSMVPFPVFAEEASNPIIWADVPDISIVRIGDTYYMSSTTMHLSPGLPIMKSKNLVDWDIVSYAYDVLEDTDGLSLRNEKNEYGAGSWASSIRYNDGTFYVSTFAGSVGKTFVYSTKNVENKPWNETAFRPMLHDHSLFFDDDGKVYMLHGATDLRLTELKTDLSGVKPGGFDEVVIKNVGYVSHPEKGWGEGSQIFKINEKYYLCNITWPDMRTQLVHRADSIKGPYEGRVILHDQGVAQGGLIDTPDGRWYAYLFQDCGAVGRVPFLVPLKWEDGWPVLGKEGKIPMRLDIKRERKGLGNLVVSDEFDRPAELLDRLKTASKRDEYVREAFPPAWQWNHNPANMFWSLSDRSGWLRITTGRTDKLLTEARDSLTQRTFGPACSATIMIDVSGMKDGDYAGLAALQKKYGFVGVKMENNIKSIVMVDTDGEGKILGEKYVSFEGNTVHLRIDCDFRNRKDEAMFFWSLDGKDWTPIGKPFHMIYTLPHFMGYRFALFYFATQNPGGHVDFDYYRIDGVE